MIAERPVYVDTLYESKFLKYLEKLCVKNYSCEKYVCDFDSMCDGLFEIINNEKKNMKNFIVSEIITYITKKINEHKNCALVLENMQFVNYSQINRQQSIISSYEKILNVLQ